MTVVLLTVIVLLVLVVGWLLRPGPKRASVDYPPETWAAAYEWLASHRPPPADGA
jgi:hypothetical protein